MGLAREDLGRRRRRIRVGVALDRLGDLLLSGWSVDLGLVLLERIRGQLSTLFLFPFSLKKTSTRSKTDPFACFFSLSLFNRLQIPSSPPRRKRPLHVGYLPPFFLHLLLLQIPSPPRRKSTRTSPRPYRLSSNPMRQTGSEDGDPQS